MGIHKEVKAFANFKLQRVPREGLWQHKDSTTPISSAGFRKSNWTRWPSSLLDGPSMIKIEEEEEEEPTFNDQIHSKMSFWSGLPLHDYNKGMQLAYVAVC